MKIITKLFLILTIIAFSISLNLKKKEDKEYVSLKNKFEQLVKENNNHHNKIYNFNENEASNILQNMYMEKIHRNPINSNKNLNSLHLE